MYNFLWTRKLKILQIVSLTNKYILSSFSGLNLLLNFEKCNYLYISLLLSSHFSQYTARKNGPCPIQQKNWIQTQRQTLAYIQRNPPSHGREREKMSISSQIVFGAISAWFIANPRGTELAKTSNATHLKHKEGNSQGKIIS